MNRRLSRLLEFAYAGSLERKELMSDPAFRRDVGEDTIKYLEEKKLLQTEDIASDTLLLEEVLKTVYHGAEPFRCFRDVLPIVKTNSPSVRIVLSDTAGYAVELTDGAEIPDKTTKYSKVEISSKIVGTRAGITNALIEDALFDVIELEIEKIGARLENKLNQDALTALLEGADSSNDIDPATSTFALSHVAESIGKIKGNNYFPTDFIMLPFAEAQLYKDSNLVYVNQAGTDITLREGKIPKLLGITPWTCSVVTDSDSVSWDETDADGHYMAMVLDAKNAGLITMQRDITIKNAENILADLVNIVGTMRYGIGVIRDAAISRILTNTPS